MGLNRSELQTEVRDIANEMSNAIVRCAQRYAKNDRSTRLRVYYDQLENRWMTLVAPSNMRGPSTTFPKRNMFATMAGLAGAFASEQVGVSELQKIAAGYGNDLDRYFRAASGAGYWQQFPPEYPDPVEWVLNETALHCHDCPEVAGVYPNMRTLLRASNNRVPRSLDLACHGNCLCKLQSPGA
jgi:hypothetical protein